MASTSKGTEKDTSKLSMKGTRKLSGKEKITVKTKMGTKYRLLEDIKHSVLYRKTGRDEAARKAIEANAQIAPKNKIVPGQLILFNYFEPKTKDELEYYDASPCTIFFGVFNTQKGEKRILGFNLHYYPPKLRFQIMDKIFQMYRPVMEKYFTTGNTKAIDAFDYHYLKKQLRRMGLDFGLREYIPKLVGDPRLLPPNMWVVGAFTEGWFKKKTKQRIFDYWRGKNGKLKY